jgi:hypothetical protein
MSIEVVRQLEDPRLRLGLCETAGGVIRDSSTPLRQQCRVLVAQLAAQGFELDEAVRSAVRQCLKGGGFSPTGRNRPAQELLLNELKERGEALALETAELGTSALPEFHWINNAVDVNNLISLQARLPISIFDTGKLEGRLVLRYGQEGESYVFNASGHSLDLKRCVICARGAGAGEPCGSPVKDSMATKIFEGAAGLLGVIYAPALLWSAEDLLAEAQRFGRLLAAETGGEFVSAAVL